MSTEESIIRKILKTRNIRTGLTKNFRFLITWILANREFVKLSGKTARDTSNINFLRNSY